MLKCACSQGQGSCSPLLVTSWQVGCVPNSAEGMQAEGSAAKGPCPGPLHDRCEGKWGGHGQGEEALHWEILLIPRLFLTAPFQTPHPLHQQRHCLAIRIPSNTETHRCRQALALPHSPPLACPPLLKPKAGTSSPRPVSLSQHTPATGHSKGLSFRVALMMLYCF